MKILSSIFKISGFGIIIFVISIVMNACAIQPVAWKPPVKPALEGDLVQNETLHNIEKIDLKGWYGAEDIITDEVGNLYFGVHRGKNDFSDGKIMKRTVQGELEVFYDAKSWAAGLHFDNQNNLIALSHRQGLISINSQKKVTVLATKDEKNRPFLIPNGLDIASDGMIYFSNTSHESAYNIKYGRKLILEMKPNGGLYKYNPVTGKIKTLIDGTYFGNGITLSQDESYILMTETTKYRILRYWLKGKKKGQTEVFMDNLPGFPNGISIRENGTFWLGFTTCRNDALDNIHPKVGMKKLVYGLPNFMQPKQDLFGLVLNISEEGTILKALYDTSGKFVSEAGAVKEYNGKLYLGGDIVPYISVYDLKVSKLKSISSTD